MRKKWVTGLVLGSLFFQVSSPMIGYAQGTMESTTASSSTTKKEEESSKSLTNTNSSKENSVPVPTVPKPKVSIDTSNSLNAPTSSTNSVSDSEKQASDKQEATEPSVQAAGPAADENLGPELFQNSKFIDWGGVSAPTTIPGWSVLSGAYSMNVSVMEWPQEEITHERMRVMLFNRNETMIYQDVSVTPGSTLSFGNFYTSFIQVSKDFTVYAGPISNNLEDFSVVDAFTPPAGNNVWKRVNFVVPQGMNKMRIIIKGKRENGIPAKFTGFSLKQDLNPPVNTAAPVINASDRRLALNTTFDPLEGVTATDAEDGNIPLTEVNVVKNDVDTGKEGAYSVTYSVTDSGGLTTRKTITVTVGNANTPPVIHLPNPSVSVAQGDTFDPSPAKWNITANDAEDGNLTSKIKVDKNTVDTTKPGNYVVTYSVTDSGNLRATADMTVVVTPKPTGSINLTVNDNGSMYQVPLGEDLKIKGTISATGGKDLFVSVRTKGAPVRQYIDSQWLNDVPLGEKRDYELSVPTDGLSLGQIYEYTVRAEDGSSTPVEKNISMIVVKPEPAHTLDLTVDQDTFDVEEGENVEITGELWAPADANLQAILTEEGSSKALDLDIFIGSLANQLDRCQ